MKDAKNAPAVLGPVERQVRPGAEARHLPTPEELRSYAEDADQHGNHWVPTAPASLRGMADELDRLRDEFQLCCELKRMYQEQAAAERERCAKLVEEMDVSGHDGYIETSGDLLVALAGCIRREA